MDVNDMNSHIFLELGLVELHGLSNKLIISSIVGLGSAKSDFEFCLEFGHSGIKLKLSQLSQILCNVFVITRFSLINIKENFDDCKKISAAKNYEANSETSFIYRSPGFVTLIGGHIFE